MLKAGVIEAEDMLPEVALVKLMWLCKQYNDLDTIKKMMVQNIAFEISERSIE
jgi:glutamyl-tRNA(Gln) amidotransferase subunit D